MYATTKVNVRSLPNTSGKVIGVLQVNDSITALGEAVDGWQKVIYNEKEAYVSAKYLTTEYIVMHPEITAEDIVIPELNGDSPIIVIDAGHQEFVNSDLEPIGPGATTTKKKVSRGTYGCVSEWWEYELNLVVALKLKEELISRGYQVVMIRETHAINISNSERAKVANNVNADAFIRIHANGSTNQNEQGAFTICQTPENVYNGDKYESFRKLSDCIIDGFVESTGCVKLEVLETDTMSGINWAQVPTTILEMGYMTNPTEDALLATDEYQNKMVKGIADGLDMFFQP
ncbi:MAG: N-acetylmuramoyl-L-alanine amidase, partial [Agathobacter sp.]